MNEIDFGALLCARLCHDLISPVSAARNGIAMVQGETDPVMRTDAIALTEDGLIDTIDKLKVYRIAYGVAGSGTTLVEARAAALGLYDRGRVRVDWSEGGTDPGPEAVRLLLNLVLLGADAVARGGIVRVVSYGPAPAIKATGGRAGFAPDVLSVLDGKTPPEALTPRQIQAALTMRLAARVHHTIAHTSTDGAVSLSTNA